MRKYSYYVMDVNTRLYATEEGWTENITEAFLCDDRKDAQTWIEWNFDFPLDLAVVIRNIRQKGDFMTTYVYFKLGTERLFYTYDPSFIPRVDETVTIGEKDYRVKSINYEYRADYLNININF